MKLKYAEFLDRKSQLPDAGGFEPVWLPGTLIDFQTYMVEKAIRRGRSAIFADCGLGKTPMQFVFAENVARHTNKRVLVATTLGDSAQAVREAAKFGVEAVRSRDGKLPAGAKIVVTNYERLHLFDPAKFAGFVGNESSCLKNESAKRVATVAEFARRIPYRLLATATAAPNDFDELGSSSEVLGDLGHADMVTRYFVKRHASRSGIGWGRVKYRLRGHAEQDFWRWVCSWAQACRRPSDLGFDDGRFVLPPLEEEEITVATRTPRPGFLFDPGAANLSEEAEERRRTVRERCETVAELVAADPAEAWACWGALNSETRLLAKLIPGAVEVKGGADHDRKEEVFSAFAAGQVKTLVTKPTIAAFGLNWQHCARVAHLPTHSFEQYYQLVRRFWRFGQTRPVKVKLVVTDGQAGILANLRRKQDQAGRMFDRLVSLMNNAMRVGRTAYGDLEAEVPSWL